MSPVNVCHPQTARATVEAESVTQCHYLPSLSLFHSVTVLRLKHSTSARKYRYAKKRMFLRVTQSSDSLGIFRFLVLCRFGAFAYLFMAQVSFFTLFISSIQLLYFLFMLGFRLALLDAK